MEKETYIKVTDGGPYLVFGELGAIQKIIVSDEEGASWNYEDGKKFAASENPAALCRCGHSRHAPFCDGNHERTEWDGQETASFKPIKEEAEAFDGPNLTLWDNERYCAYARFCDARGRIWNLVMEGTPEADELCIREAAHCCAGRLMVETKDGQPVEPQLEKSIGVVEDPQLGCSGPLWVRGGIRVESAGGRSYEVRNRQTLCRCGQSSNKPFCDGSHASVMYNDGIGISRE